MLSARYIQPHCVEKISVASRLKFRGRPCSKRARLGGGIMLDVWFAAGGCCRAWDLQGTIEMNVSTTCEQYCKMLLILHKPHIIYLKHIRNIFCIARIIYITCLKHIRNTIFIKHILYITYLKHKRNILCIARIILYLKIFYVKYLNT